MKRSWEREQQRKQQRGPNRCQHPGCRARVVFLKVLKKDGTISKPIPFDRDWKFGDGKKTLYVLADDGAWHRVPNAPPNVRGRETHFATCPYAREFSGSEQQPRS